MNTTVYDYDCFKLPQPAAVALGVVDYCTPSLLDAGSMEKPGIIMALQDVVKVCPLFILVYYH